MRALILALSLSVTGCAATSSQKAPALDRTHVPQGATLKPFQFPTPAEMTLPNGLRVLVLPQPEQPIVALTLLLPAGSGNNPVTKPGLAALTAAMLTEGTVHRTAAELAAATDDLGASLEADATWDSTTISLSLLKKHVGTGLPLLADVAIHPAFARPEFERLRQQHLTELLQAKDVVDDLAAERFAQLLFAGHPFAFPELGTESSLNSLTPQDLLAFHQSHFRPNQAVLAVVGDVTLSELQAPLEKAFGGWQQGSPAAGTPPPAAASKSGLFVVDKPGAVQSSIRLGHLGVARNIPDHFPLLIAQTMLGGKFDSRLNRNLREEKGYTYGASAAFGQRKVPGPFIAVADVQTEVTGPAVGEFLKEIKRMVTEPLPFEEVERTQSYLAGGFPLKAETPLQLSQLLLSQVLYGLPADYLSAYREQVLKVTPEEVQKAARRYIHPDRLTIVVAGDAAKISPMLTPYGPLTVFNTDGKVVTAGR